LAIASDQKRLVVDAFARYHIKEPLKYYQATGNNDVTFRSQLGSLINGYIRRELGTDQVFDVVGEVFPGALLEKLFRDMYARLTDEHKIQDRIVKDISPERFRAITEGDALLAARMREERRRAEPVAEFGRRSGNQKQALGPVGAWVRDRFVALILPTLMRRSADWLYNYQPAWP